MTQLGNAQLANDCLVAGETLLTLDQALERLSDAQLSGQLPVRVKPQTVPLSRALGRVLARPVIAPHPVPPYDNAAVDGYAVFLADLNPSGSTDLKVAGRAAAGHPLSEPMRRGQAVKIFTGAPLPVDEHGQAPDAIYMLEDTESLSDQEIRVPAGLRKGDNIREAGEDIPRHKRVFEAGQRLGPAELGVIAGLGRKTVSVYAQLKVAIFSTGDEIAAPGQKLAPGQLYDANRPMISGFLERLGFKVTDLGILPDRLPIIRDVLRQAASTHHAILSSGGMSMGEEDHVRIAIESLGDLHFWKLAIKPGRPLGIGLVKGMVEGAPPALAIGLPGNTVAAFTTFALVGRAALKLLSGEQVKPLPRFPVICNFPIKKKAGRREFIRVRLCPDSSAHELTVEKAGRSGAGILSSVAAADGFLDLPEDCQEVREGEPVDFLPFAQLWT